jgi:hypothetical protein
VLAAASFVSLSMKSLSDKKGGNKSTELSTKIIFIFLFAGGSTFGDFFYLG